MNILEPNYRILVSVTGDNSITITSSPSFSAKSVAQVEKNQWRKNQNQKWKWNQKFKLFGKYFQPFWMILS